jgi:hypothetical protein
MVPAVITGDGGENPRRRDGGARGGQAHMVTWEGFRREIWPAVTVGQTGLQRPGCK